MSGFVVHRFVLVPRDCGSVCHGATAAVAGQVRVVSCGWSHGVNLSPLRCALVQRTVFVSTPPMLVIQPRVEHDYDELATVGLRL
eukprot:1101194-Rhodomonas_salina.1